MSILTEIRSFGIGGLVEVVVLACLYYYIFLFFRGTRGAHVLAGLVLLMIVLMGLTRMLNLNELNWLLRQFSVYLAVALLIIFQPEIRSVLSELGRQRGVKFDENRRTVVDSVARAARQLSRQRVGALIALERRIGIRATEETGTKLDAEVTPELLASIFFPLTPLHDGGVIIRNNRIVAAGCLFPLSQRTEISKQLGTRHRAGIGLTEESDAVVVVVSAETGAISTCYRGQLTRDMDEDKLRESLSTLLLREQKPERWWQRAGEYLDLAPEDIAKTREDADADENADLP